MAKQRTRYSGPQWVATVIGLTLIGLDAFGAFQYAYGVEANAITYMTLAAPVVAGAAGVLPILAERAWSDGHLSKAVVLAVAFLFAGAVVVMAALERTATKQGHAIEARQRTNQPVALARAALLSAETALAKAQAEAAAECTSGRGPKCRGLEQREDAARQRVSDARAALAHAGVEVTENPQAKALAALLPISEGTVELYAPAVLPLAMLVTGFVCLWYGAARRTHQGRRKPEKKAKARKRTARKPPPIRSTDVTAANVIPFPAVANEN